MELGILRTGTVNGLSRGTLTGCLGVLGRNGTLFWSKHTVLPNTCVPTQLFAHRETGVGTIVHTFGALRAPTADTGVPLVTTYVVTPFA